MIQSFDDFVKEKFITIVNSFSNSGKTHYGLQVYIHNKNYGSNVRTKDEMFFTKLYSELNEEELIKYKHFFETEYKIYFNKRKKELEYKSEITEYVNKNLEFLKTLLPIEYYMHWSGTLSIDLSDGDFDFNEDGNGDDDYEFDIHLINENEIETADKIHLYYILKIKNGEMKDGVNIDDEYKKFKIKEGF